MLGSRRRHASVTRKDVPALWPTESDAEQGRPTMRPGQKPTTDYGAMQSNDRNHRPSRRPDADQTYATAQSHYPTTTTTTHPAMAAVASSRARPPDLGQDSYDLRAYLKKKTTDRRSPRSSEEKLYAPDKQSRYATQSRTGHPTATPASHGTAQSYYTTAAQPSRDPVIPQRDRDRDADREKAEARERRRQEKEAARARIEEEKARVRAYEREREKARERRREEKELQRAEREREKEQERRREEKDQERLRRHREKERSREQPRGRDNNPYPHLSASAQISAAAGALKQYAEHKLSSRHQPSDQIPSSSSNLALPKYAATSQPTGSNPRLQTTSDARRDDNPHMAPPHVPAKDRKRHRSHRDKGAAQQSAQESGFSSSEQEHSGRERPPRVAERRYTNRDPYDVHHSGPSGSENERNPRDKARRMSKTYVDGYGGDPRTGGVAQVQGSVQPSVPVGPTSFQQYVPQIVSIRAGQGPADPSTPQLRSKTPLVSAQGRSRDVQQATPMSGHIQPSYAQQGHPLQSQYIQQGSSRQLQPMQDNVSRLYNVLGMSSQAPLPPLPPEASLQHSQSDQLTGRPSYTPPSGQPAHSTITPKSMAPSLPKEPPSVRSLAVPSNADYRSAPPQNTSGYSPGMQGVQFSSDPPSQSAAHFASLSVYQHPGPAISAEIILPAGATDLPDGTRQFVTVTQTTVKDLAAKFPLNEDLLTSASSSTLAGNSPSANQQGPSNHTPPQQRRSSEDQPRPMGGYAAESMLSPNWAPTPASQSKSLGARNVFDENDVPIPIPAPRTMASAPATSAMPSQPDSRSQKQMLPPLPNVLAASQQAPRPQPTPLQSKGVGLYGQPETAYGAQYTSTRNPQGAGMQAPTGMNIHPSNHSPSRSIQQTIKGSPASGNNGALLANATPKHSPSQRLQGRNGSTDTVQMPPAKSSPSYPAKSMQTNVTNMQQPYASSRNDTNPTRSTNVTLEYPDTGRYRSQTPAYPSTAPPQQSTYLPTQTAIPNNQPHSSTGHHSRSISQPVVQFQPDQYAPPVRSHTIPAPSISTVAAIAPSASAIVAAYRSGNYNSESQGRAQDPISQRAPPRSSPSPAPTVTGRAYAAQGSLASKATYAQANGPSQQPRGQTTLVQRPTGLPPPTTSGTHSRTQSDPQFTAPPPRVPVAGHLSTPAPPKAQLTYHPSPSELSLLKTPSSIAPSMLKSAPPPARPPSVQASKPPKSSSKKGIFGLFRSRSSPPKQDARVPPEPATATTAPVKTRQRSSSQTTITAVAASVRNIISPHPAPQQTSRAPPMRAATTVPPASAKPALASELDARRRATPANVQQPAPIVAPSPVRGRPMEGGSGTKMFTPFRLLSKHHRTVSSASVEALDGTAANTVIGGESARSSTAGRPSPPLRDPFVATQDWRNREEEALRDRGTWRRRRPGVVFDVVEEFTDTETHHPARKQSRGERR